MPKILRSLKPLLLAGVVVLAGCGKSTGPSSPGTPAGTAADVQHMLTSTYVPGTVLPTNADTTASLLATMDVLGLRAASAVLLANGHLGSGGTITVDVDPPVGTGTTELALDQLSVNYAGTTEYAYSTLPSHPLGVNLPFDGTRWHRFTVAGTTGFGGLVDSVRSVGMIAVSAPAAAATVTRSAGLTVSWSDAGTDTTVYVICAVTSQADSTRRATGALARDTDGSTTISAARLGTLPAGAARLAVTRYRLVYADHGGHRVGMACAATAVRALTLD